MNIAATTTQGTGAVPLSQAIRFLLARDLS